MPEQQRGSKVQGRNQEKGPAQDWQVGQCKTATDTNTRRAGHCSAAACAHTLVAPAPSLTGAQQRGTGPGASCARSAPVGRGGAAARASVAHEQAGRDRCATGRPRRHASAAHEQAGHDMVLQAVLNDMRQWRMSRRDMT